MQIMCMLAVGALFLGSSEVVTQEVEAGSVLADERYLSCRTCNLIVKRIIMRYNYHDLLPNKRFNGADAWRSCLHIMRALRWF